MPLILFVCRGNTCRSPMAEVAARDAVGKLAQRLSVTFASAGVAVSDLGQPADPRAIACVAMKGLNLQTHRARQADELLLTSADRIYALDRSVRDRLLELIPDGDRGRIALLTNLIPAAGIEDIDDPWSGTAADYEIAFTHIRNAVDVLAAKLAAGMPG